jgi:putative drug exporter of the RND superfamily
MAVIVEEAMLDRLRTAPAGRRAKWVVLVVWVAAAGGLGQYQAKLQDATKNDPASFLPANAESTRVLHTLRNRFTNGPTTPGLVIWSRRGGLSSADRNAAAAAVARIRSLRLPATLPPSPPTFTRETAVTAVPVTADDVDQTKPVVERVGGLVASGRPAGLDTYVTGPAGITVDAVDVFGQIDVKLLAATTALVLVLLLLIYRSPVGALVPLAVVKNCEGSPTATTRWLPRSRHTSPRAAAARGCAGRPCRLGLWSHRSTSSRA